MGGKATKWKPRLNEEVAHPRFESMGSCFRHGHCHARGPTKEENNRFCLIKKQNWR